MTATNALEKLRMRLLDLTARNRLINFRHTKRGSLRIIDELPNQLVETLLADTEMRFLPVPEPSRDELIEKGYIELDEETGQEILLRGNPTAEEWAKQLGLSTSYDVPQQSESEDSSKHADTAIQTLLYPYELETRLKSLLQTSTSAIQEMGANILYLAFGFLEWFDSNNENGRIAPLFLVPVQLNKGKLNRKTKIYEYTLRYTGEDIIPNLSLREKLRIDFAMALPDLNEDTEPEVYFDELQALINKNQPRWRIRRYITVSLLNFSKLLMYLDLDATRWPTGKSITDHPVVARFLVGYDSDEKENERAGDDFGFGEEYRIDELDDIHSKFPLIDDADSSQHSALIDAIDGKNLVIEGPPGTGKSQTITNLIAAAMAQGKRVLFVAEKLAALEVVKRRLDLVGLGEFCLELHSHKSQKRKVLDEIERRLSKYGHYRHPADIDVDIERYEELKTVLNEHASRINRPWKNTGKTLHEIFMTATRYRELLNINPEVFHPDRFDSDNFDAVTQRRLGDQVGFYRKAYKAVINQLDGDVALHKHPWYGVCNTDLQFFDLDHVKAELLEWQDALKVLSDRRALVSEELNCEISEIANSLSGLAFLLEDLDIMSTLKGNELLDRLPVLRGEVFEEVQQYLKLFEDIQDQYASLAEKVEPKVLGDLSMTDEFLKGREQLSRLVVEDVHLGELSDSINELNAISKQLSEWDKPLKQIRAAVGDRAAKDLMITIAGLTEFKDLVAFVIALNPSYWQLRDERFDNDVMDELLPLLRFQIDELYALREELQDVFNLEDFPSERKLQQLKDTLDFGGAFSWLKGGWRSARKQVLSYTKNAQIKLSDVRPMLEKAAEYSGRLYELDDNKRFKHVFGDHMKGLDTDLSALESLRDWYKKVRLHYGVGFGENVALGDAILDLPVSIAKGIRSFSERGLLQQLEVLLDDLEGLKWVFLPVSEFQEDTALLVGSDGVIPHLLQSLDESIRSCGPMVDDNECSIAELADRIGQIDSLKNMISAWEEKDLDNKLFQGRLGFRVGMNIDNSNSLAVLRNTLAIATHLDQDIKNKVVSQHIYDQPTKANIGTLADLSAQLRTELKLEAENYESFKNLVVLNSREWMKGASDQLDLLINRASTALDNGESLQNWLDYVRVRDQLSRMGLDNLAEAAEKGTIDVDQLETAFQAGIYDVLAREVFHKYPKLGHFSGHSQEAIQDKFKEYDNKLKDLQCKKIAWQIDQTKVPRGSSGARVSSLTELTLIEHECGKKKRHIPIRQLLHRASGALVALKPCFMMGPMSVAQYLAPGKIEFDLVVMDEASQIKPQDALGAIARGAQLVVVGDPKQLPPTSFFDRIIEDDDEDPTAIEESESILDATHSMFPARRLRWHYRSQHESLIAFSNHSFYDSNLVLFPSPYKSTESFGIKYTRIPRGCFINRQNLEEAKIISEAVREHFKYHPEETLGVVAMSAEQRLKIEQAIETLAKDDAVFGEWLEEDARKYESLFIKNLENVQGDERDVIFISMTYGPQEPGGKVFQRFGPINTDVGHRRLNVLFTRSKKRMHIFSSMGSEDIVASASSKRGVKALRDFLSYCETGILHKTEMETGRPPDSDFEISVMTALQNEGFECVPQVGVAGFFIDVAVIDPGSSGRYLMGIECDGATYHSAKSARDRDRLRQTILERLGWRICRIWSTDWFKNPSAELQPIIRELNDLKTIRIDEEIQEVDSEVAEIGEILEEIEEKELVADQIISENITLKEKLIQFDREVIRERLSDIPQNQQILRQAMLEAFLEYLPVSKSEFLEYIPSYLREHTNPEEGKFLQNILDIINTDADTGTVTG